MILASLSTTAVAFDASVINDPDQVVAAEIKEFVDSQDPIVTWTRETIISDKISLYDFGGEISGYIYHLTTSGNSTGFIQLNLVDDEFVPFAIGFEGEDYLTSLLGTSTMAKKIGSKQQIYYEGGLNYYVAETEGKTIDLLNNQILDYSIAELNDKYQEYVQNQLLLEITEEELVEEEYAERVADGAINAGKSSRAAKTTTIYNYEAGSASYRNTRYYVENYNSTLKNHCTPTAATNMVLYWSVARGHTKLGTDAIDIFEYMYDNMGTTRVNGTLYKNVFAPIENYFWTYDSDSSLVASQWTGVTFNRIKSVIDDDIPVQLEIDDWSRDIGHSVNVWGYNTGGSYNYYYVTTNLNTNNSRPTYSLLNINDYNNYVQFEYAGYLE